MLINFLKGLAFSEKVIIEVSSKIIETDEYLNVHSENLLFLHIINLDFLFPIKLLDHWNCLLKFLSVRIQLTVFPRPSLLAGGYLAQVPSATFSKFVYVSSSNLNIMSQCNMEGGKCQKALSVSSFTTLRIFLLLLLEQKSWAPSSKA